MMVSRHVPPVLRGDANQSLTSRKTLLDYTESMNAHILTQEDLRWLVCPICRQRLLLEAISSVRCAGCSRLFPIIDGIPVLLASRATLIQ